MRDQYTTIVGQKRGEIKVRGSRFIASAHQVASRKEADQVVAGLRREFFDATHHCYAYRIGPDGSDFRAVDGGEPSGTAGKPILAAIDRAGLTNILLVVTRYFGGTKLGVGGLARAYGEAASAVLATAPTRVCHAEVTLRVTFAHALVSPVMHAVGKIGARIVSTDYDEDTHMTLSVRASRVEELEASLTERARGAIRIRREG